MKYATRKEIWYYTGMNKEKIKNFLQNCTEKQFKEVCCGNQYPIDIYTSEFYDCNNQLYKLKRAIVYDDSIKDRRLVKDVIFALEEDERKFLFEGYGLRYLNCTSEYGKYLFDKYHLSEQKFTVGPMWYKHRLFKENKFITQYFEKTHCALVNAPSLWEEYKYTYMDY